MWAWFKGQKRPKETPVSLEERVVALEGELRGMRLEWVNTFDQLTRIAGRIDAGKRWLAEKAGTAPAPSENGAPGATEEKIPIVPAPAPEPAAKMSRSELMASWKS